jgi:hypothetical protein
VTALIIVLGAALLMLSAAQVALVLPYLRRVSEFETPNVADEELPAAAIVLALRGADPFIEECLHRLSIQEYPRYRVRVVVDHPQDDAMKAVEEWRRTHSESNVVVEFLRDPSPDSTLYCSSLRQAISSLDPEVEVVAFANADTMPHPLWLRSLASPLTLPGVGAVTGHRWYLPTTGMWGSLVRYVQNSSALVVMDQLKLDMLWGGSLAIRRYVFGSPIFMERLREACCEDQAIHETLLANNERVFPSLAVLMVNREECTFGWAYRFLRRQLLWTRLYHPRWNELVLQAGLMAALGAVVPIACALALRQEAWTSLVWLLVGIGALLAANLFSLSRTHTVVMKRVRAEQGDVGRLPLRLLPKLLLALPLTAYVYSAAVLSARWLRQVEWRGIRYDVTSHRRIRLVAYEPYRRTTNTRQNVSL